MYELLNLKWGDPTYGTPSGVITWSDDNFIDSLDIGGAFTTTDIENALDAAFLAWENVAAVDFQEVGSGGALELTSASLDPGVAGVASFPGGFGFPYQIDNADITFADGLTWSPGTDGDPTTVDFYAVALHEIGHILGLDHVADTSEIMNATIFASDLGDGDIDGAQFIYGTDAGDPPADPPPDDDGGGRSDSGGDGGGGGGAGLLLGLLALLFGVFTGGAGAAVFAAAATLPGDDEDDEEPSEDARHAHGHACTCDHCQAHHVDAEGMVHHVLYLPTIPVEEDAEWSVGEEDGTESWLL